ncbi:hypothetical protein C8F04DRAFT_1196427 [Mycena alexandri]|uniref:Uncharacterized protein n=1 Tax=Mycena alexandri TaxID=1745969 RepID=A0AAD6WTS2_9AGAR|nr:hypothetical protein C8F04DRAFT_1196427 [Mycena alexandri]
MATDIPDPTEFHKRCKILLRDDGAFEAWFAAYNAACDKCSRANKICAKALGQPGCTGCIASKVRCSLQETYLFEKTSHEFGGKRHEFDALRSAKKPRRRTAEEPRRRTAARGPSSTPVARGSTTSLKSTLQPPPMFPLDYAPTPFSDRPHDSSSDPSAPAMFHPHAVPTYAGYVPPFNGSGVHNAAYFTDQPIDPALLPPVADLMDTSPLDLENGRAPALSHMIHQGVQTDNVRDAVNDPVPPLADTVLLPDVPLETLDIQELCNFHAARPLNSLSREEIPAELVAQCFSAIFNGHFEMLVAFSATRHRLRASTAVPPDVMQHIDNLSMECHNCLSQMMARLDEGRRSAPDLTDRGRRELGVSVGKLFPCNRSLYKNFALGATGVAERSAFPSAWRFRALSVTLKKLLIVAKAVNTTLASCSVMDNARRDIKGRIGQRTVWSTKGDRTTRPQRDGLFRTVSWHEEG